MGETRKIKTKVLFKHETAKDWYESKYIPEIGEKVLYDPDPEGQYSYTRVKYGDGIHRVHDLPFSGSKADWLENDENSSGYVGNRPFYEDENGVKKLDNKFLDLENNELIQKIDTKIVNADYEQTDEKDLSYIKNRPFHENEIVEEKYTPADAIESVRIHPSNIDALLVSTNPYSLDKLVSLKMITQHNNIGTHEAILNKEDAKEINEYGYSFSCQLAYVIVALHKDYRPSVIGTDGDNYYQLPQAGIYITQQGAHGDDDSVLECTFATTRIKKLDNKFLDLQNNEDFKRVERLVATPDYSINSANELGYIKNRPFYEDDEKKYSYSNTPNSINYINFHEIISGYRYSGRLIRVGPEFSTEQIMGAKVIGKYQKINKVESWTIDRSNIVEDTLDGTWLKIGDPTLNIVRYIIIVRDLNYKPSCISSKFTQTGIYLSSWTRADYPYIDSISFSAKRMNPLEGRFIDLRGNDRYENLIDRVDDLEDGQDEIYENIETVEEAINGRIDDLEGGQTEFYEEFCEAINDLEEAIDGIPKQQQADYAENNETSLTYIKNRPFYDTSCHDTIFRNDQGTSVSGVVNHKDGDVLYAAYHSSDKVYTKDQLIGAIADIRNWPGYPPLTEKDIVEVDNGLKIVIASLDLIWIAFNNNCKADYYERAFPKPGVYLVCYRGIVESLDAQSLSLNHTGEIKRIEDKFVNSNVFASQSLGGAEQLDDGCREGIDAKGAFPKTAELGKIEENFDIPYQLRLWQDGDELMPFGAIGNFSQALGGKSYAQGKRAHAEGSTTYAKGAYSHAEGVNTAAYHDSSHAEGGNTLAQGERSHAEGHSTITRGYSAHSEGAYTMASGDHSHAEGQYTKASNLTAHSEGFWTEAQGQYSHAEGGNTKATKDGSHAEGYQSEANGLYSHAEGQSSKAGGTGAHAEGTSTEATHPAAHSEGNDTHAQNNAAHAEGYITYATGQYSHAEGGRTTASNSGAHAEGYQSEAKGLYSHAENYNTHAEGNYSHTEGIDTKTYGEGSHAEGASNRVYGRASHVEGANNFVYGKQSHAEGYDNRIGIEEGIGITGNGDFSYAGGSHNLITKQNSFAHGTGNAVYAERSAVFGQGNISNHNDQLIVGKYNKNRWDALFEVGCGSGASGETDERKNAFEVRKDGRVTIAGAPFYSTDAVRLTELQKILPWERKGEEYSRPAAGTNGAFLRWVGSSSSGGPQWVTISNAEDGTF